MNVRWETKMIEDIVRGGLSGTTGLYKQIMQLSPEVLTDNLPATGGGDDEDWLNLSASKTNAVCSSFTKQVAQGF